jgi:methyltransferase (TIGR00027 family)
VTERTSSNTAVGVALLRAAHQVLDGEPLILRDPVAFALLDPAAERHVREHAQRFQAPSARALRAHVVLRSRFAEDRLAEAVRRGVRQYVILGAGLDTFADRQPAWAADVSVFEVDHPASQQAKRERLAAGGVEIPENAWLVPVDFEREALRHGLARGGVDLAAPVFFSWLGVTMYLSEDAVDAVFRTVAALPPGSEIAFTFAPPDRDPPSADPDRPALAERAAAVGEPWLTFFEPAVLREELRGFGFSRVDFLTPAHSEARYFAGRTDGLLAPRRTSIASAVV